MRIAQAGLDLVEAAIHHRSASHFRRGRCSWLAFMVGADLWRRRPAFAAASACRAGSGFLASAREKAFLTAFPDAVDVIVRGVKAGLPLSTA